MFYLVSVSSDEEEEDAIAMFGFEGRLLLRIHRSRERSPQLVKAKKDEAKEKYGKLSCEVCDFTFTAQYGEHGSGFIECHHREPYRKSQKAGRRPR